MTQADPGSGTRMVVRFQVEGGFAHIPGLSRTLTLDTDDLDPAEGNRLRALLSEADFFTRPGQEGIIAPGAADYRTYTITATQGGMSHSIRVTDPISDPGLGNLVDQLIEWQRRAR